MKEIQIKMQDLKRDINELYARLEELEKQVIE